MADQDPQDHNDPLNDASFPPIDDFNRPVEEEPEESAAPRRAASAEFIVQAEVESDVALREAMDPANQSLTDALRLSYRILQFVMVVLIILFMGSGLVKVDSNQSGVLTRFGAIVGDGSSPALEDGLKFNWPYPIGEYVLFDVQNRQIDVKDTYFTQSRVVTRDTFLPGTRPNQTLDETIGDAREFDTLRPGRDGYVITEDGGMAHFRLSATYKIDDPVAFIRAIPGKGTSDEANDIVKVALKRAAIHVSARSSLQDITDRSEVLKSEIQTMAQRMLDDLGTGIGFESVTVTDPNPPQAIRKSQRELGDAKAAALANVQRYRERAGRVLTSTAGANYQQILSLIEQYEEALEIGDDDDAETTLQQIYASMEDGRTAGEVSAIINRARAYRDRVQSTLGAEASRFQSILAAFREHPELVIQQRLLEARSFVTSRPDAEVYYVLDDMGSTRLAIEGSDEVAEMRRKLRTELQARQAGVLGFETFADQRLKGLRSSSDISDGPGRQLDVGEDGRIKAPGDN